MSYSKRIPRHMMIEEYKRDSIGAIIMKVALYLLGLVTTIIAVALFSLALFGNVHAADYSIDESMQIQMHEVESGSLLMKTDEPGKYLLAINLDTDVDMEINGMIAEVSVKQSFKNTSDKWTEAVYVFPLPEDSAVNSMQMTIGDRVISGEIKKKAEAKKIYKEAKKAGKKASLVEQERPNMFTNSVANIAPGEEITVEITYLQKIKYDQGKFSLRFPMTINPRYIPGNIIPTDIVEIEHAEKTLNLNMGDGWALNTDKVSDASRITPYIVPAVEHSESESVTLVNPVSINIVLNVGLELDFVRSTYHQITETDEAGIKKIMLAKGKVSMDRDFELVWTPKVGTNPEAAIFSQEVGDDNYAMLMVMPPQKISQTVNLPKEMIYIIDTSGSMGGTSIIQAKKSLLYALDRLKANDKFNIIEFNSHTRSLSTQPMLADYTNLKTAKRFVNRLVADGGTEMAPALQRAFANKETQGYLRQVVFITDGSVGNESELFRLIQKDLGKSRLYTVGIGSAPNTYFMKKAAQFGRGTFTYIGDYQEISSKMSELFAKLESPVLHDLEIVWPEGTRQEGINPEVWPQRIPDLYLGEPLIISAKIVGSSEEGFEGDVVVKGKAADKEWSRTLKLSKGINHSGVSTIWARSKIESLMDKQIARGYSEEFKDEIVDIALTHKLLTKYTSFVAVEQKISRPQDQKLKKSLVPNAQPKGQSPQTYAYPKTATPMQRNLILGLLLVMLALVLWKIDFVPSQTNSSAKGE
ncbi:MAG: marine proteobacterial sortase target protein [Gammaproteobacteria bacterium]|nr:MAG: marine proteobacterial sortase target protein [Gammaproteobacteria bacterium]